MRKGAAELVAGHAPGTPEWHALRSTGIGGSDIAAVLGLSPWDSAFSLWHRKNGGADDKPASREMSWGNRHEDTIAGWYRDTHPGTRVARTGTWRSTVRPWQLANPDRLLSGRRVLEIKTDRSGDAWGTPGTDEVPVYYRAQVLWYLDTLGWNEAEVAVLIGLSDARIYNVRWNAEEAAVMRDAAEQFWQSLKDGVPPPLDGHDATYRTVRALRPHIDELTVELPADLAAWYLRAITYEKQAAERKQHAAAEVLSHMGTARRAVCNGQNIAIRVPGIRGGAPSLRPSPLPRNASKIGQVA
ncbi:YqaJ viral recombinase family protein [Lentzea kentuckyensis]|uniref:YqaJ viral recombinase family nuclease n=1 Tax=Lentzea kentuckyensis TaxID=360086 RepID=UPI000A387D0D|nr:YqaJ viral recombinase family protein [Lentzea kentuckyensis]